jgi:hypothetical protein
VPYITEQRKRSASFTAVCCVGIGTPAASNPRAAHTNPASRPCVERMGCRGTVMRSVCITTVYTSFPVDLCDQPVRLKVRGRRHTDVERPRLLRPVSLPLIFVMERSTWGPGTCAPG